MKQQSIVKNLHKIKEYGFSIYNYMKTLNINTVSIDTHKKSIESLKSKFNKYQQLANDSEYIEKLTKEESSIFYQNARAITDALNHLVSEINYLEATTQPFELSESIKNLYIALHTIEHLSEELKHINLRFITPKKVSISEKQWENASYDKKVESIFYEIDNLRNDFKLILDSDELKDKELHLKTLFMTIYSSLVTSQMWLDLEIKRIEREGLPKTKDIPIPDVSIPLGTKSKIITK